MAKDIVCIYSGGMDSYTLVAATFAEQRLHSCLSFYYGQRHAKELAYATRYCEKLDIPHQIVSLITLRSFFRGSALTDTVDMPEGHYAEESMKATVVPNRNMIMLSLAVAYAVSQKAKVVRYGAHSGDHTIYPDCRPEFVAAMNSVTRIANWEPVTIEAPFLDMDKTGILNIGKSLGLNYAQSWTCYQGREQACGKCGSCQERLDAFKRVGRRDPLQYEGVA